MTKRRKVRRQSKRQKARRIKAYIARIFVLILSIAVFAAVVFLCIKLFGVVKDILPGDKEGTAVAADESNAANIITINKDGSLTEISVEDFDTAEYDPDGLKKMIDETISDYNGSDEKIELKSLDIKDGMARAVISYKSPEDYAAYNEKVFSIGKASDLDITGITLANDDNEVLTHDAMEKIKGSYVMLNDDTLVNTPNTIQYVSRNVEKTGKKTAEVKKAGIDSVIIYK